MKQSSKNQSAHKNIPQSRRNSKRNNKRLLFFSMTIVITIVIISVIVFLSGDKNIENNTAVIKDANLIIPVSEISANASFYLVEIDGTRLEVLAVKAPDGSIRTAFNTCQICYDSGRGYYKQDGNTLVCQNCGNRFLMSDIERASGGCNPVPIFTENKTVTDESITISYEYLNEAKRIFANWKINY